MKNLKQQALFVLFFFAAAGSVSAQIIHGVNSKKVIVFSHNTPSTVEFNQKIDFYQNGPFDGISIYFSKEVGAGNIFMVRDWEKVTPEAKQKELEIINQLAEKQKSKSNFLLLFGASQMDWFSDEDWNLAKEHIRFAGKLAKLGNFKGIVWDPELYKPGKNPWKYDEQQWHGKYSYNEYYEQIRKRGRDFMNILQEEFPDIVILSFREISDYQTASPFSQKILPVTDNKKAVESLAAQWWGLHLPFTIGNVEAKTDKVTFIDANEEAYYYTSAIEYYKFRDLMFNEALKLVPEELRLKYKAGYSIGHAVSTDYIQGNWFDLLGGFSKELTGQGKVLTTEEQTLWFEHNLYYSLATSDEYVWIYTEKPNWWTGEGIPQSFYTAIKSARQKVENNRPLGFSVDKMLQDAREKVKTQFK